MSVALEEMLSARTRLAEAAMALALGLVAGLVWGVLLPLQVVAAIT